jgi:hypothetical protein
MATCALAIAGASLGAQGTTSTATAARDSAALWALRTDLSEQLKVYSQAQEVFYTVNKRYSRIPKELAPTFKASKGITLTILTTSKTAHSAILTSDKAPGLICAVMVGGAPTPFGGYFAPGVPLCQGPDAP